MLLKRLAHIKKDSWHYRLVAKWHAYWGEELVIHNLFEYWFYILPVCLMATAVFGAFGAFLFSGVCLIAFMMVAAVIDHPAQALWEGLVFVGTILLALIALLAAAFVVAVFASLVSKHTPDVEVD